MVQARERHSYAYDPKVRCITTSHPDHLSLNGTALAPRRREDCAPDRSCPPHAWDCPVLMKVDPGSVAWTCANCGSIITVPVGSPRPLGSATPED